MINISDQPGGSAPDFQSLVDQAIAEGVIGGIVAFLQHNRVNIKPTDKCVSPIKDFTAALLSEYVGADGYPFKNSFKEFVAERTYDELKVLRLLYDNREISNLNGLCHVIGGAAVADFLEAHRVEVLKFISSLRE